MKLLNIWSLVIMLALLTFSCKDKDDTPEENQEGLITEYNYQAFEQQPLAFGGGFEQSSQQTFTLHNDMSNISAINMYLQIDCPSGGCDDWDRFANVKVKDPETDQWYEIARYITPYWTGTQKLDRGFVFDVTDFKSLLKGTVELRIFIENWTAKADLISIEFDYVVGTPDYPYYEVAQVLDYSKNSIDGVPYGVELDTEVFDLTKTISIPDNAESTQLRTLISGWGHATPFENGRGCAEWCFRTHNVKINGVDMFSHNMGPLGCADNEISPQGGANWQGDRAGWCPGMEVPTRTDVFSENVAGTDFQFEYDYEDWVADGNSENGAYYATSTYVIVKSNSPITKPVVVD